MRRGSTSAFGVAGPDRLHRSAGLPEGRSTINVAVGSGQAPLAIEGQEHPGLSFHRPEGFAYKGDKGDKGRRDW